jgi:predicted transcriptional regulator
MLESIESGQPPSSRPWATRHRRMCAALPQATMPPTPSTQPKGILTDSRATLISVNTRNVTLSIPDDLLRQLKITAAKQETSLSAMLTRTLRQIANEEDGYAEAQRQMLKDLKKGYRLGTHAKIGWTRDDLHER